MWHTSVFIRNRKLTEVVCVPGTCVAADRAGAVSRPRGDDQVGCTPRLPLSHTFTKSYNEIFQNELFEQLAWLMFSFFQNYPNLPVFNVIFINKFFAMFALSWQPIRLLDLLYLWCIEFRSTCIRQYTFEI